MTTWHNETVTALQHTLDTDLQTGLSQREGARRLAHHGPNQLDKAKKKPLIARLLAQLTDPMILVLLAAAVLSMVASRGEDWVDAAIILVIVAVNAAISVSQEGNAEKALAALEDLTAPMAAVRREGTLTRIPAQQLVPGDILLLETGDRVPADCRVLTSAGLTVDESAMTGESMPVTKEAADQLPQETALADRTNMVISATLITGGRGTCLVTATGMDTEVGHIAGLLQNTVQTKTPLQIKMEEISKIISLLCVGVCLLLFVVGIFQGKDLLDMFLMAVSLAVAAIPEGLAATVTIVLAMGVGRMASRGAIIRRLPAVETLGCAGVVCSDKTGTLTQNKMTVTARWALSSQGERVARIAGCLCNNAVEGLGDPTEVALGEDGTAHGLKRKQLEEEFPRVGELPFDSQRKRMTTLHRQGEGFRAYVKGAPDVLLSLCDQIESEAGAVPLTPALRRQVAAVVADMAGDALRVLGCAYRDFAQRPKTFTPGQVERGLVFAGLAGMIDPPRPQVREAVAQCRRAGIRPVMITGDHKNTAMAIAQTLDMYRPGDLALTGADLDFMPQELLEEEIEKISVFARVSPAHKMRIVQAWQARGQVVAMTGDGVNDAPALKGADIGCAMGKSGTDVAKGAAAMILTDDNFSTIVQAVEQGRGIYANIKKAIHYLLSCNIGEIVTLFVAIMLGFEEMPLVPVQLLWLNLVTDSLPALALGVEPVEEGMMTLPPRQASQSLFTLGFSLRLLWQGLMVGGLTLAAYCLGVFVLGEGSGAAAVGNTMAFATLTFCQLFHAYDVRSEYRSIFHIGLLSNPAMNKAFLAGCALQLAVLLFPPLQEVFHTVDLNGLQWITVAALAVAPVAVCEIVKALTPPAKQP